MKKEGNEVNFISLVIEYGLVAMLLYCQELLLAKELSAVQGVW